jgi:predicted nucleotidyltransferase
VELRANLGLGPLKGHLPTLAQPTGLALHVTRLAVTFAGLRKPGLQGAPPEMSEIVEAAVAAVQLDARVVGLTIGGSAVVGELDEFSDIDFLVVCENGAQSDVLAEARSFAERVGPLLGAFTGEHVGEPRLLIALYGPPLLHVDFKFVAERDLADRVEDGLVAWERDGRVSALTRETAATWPAPDLQWIEDRFWIWLHYGATKLGRGEYFECLDMLSYLRSTVFGPLLAVIHGQRPQRIRRVEQYAVEAVPALEATIGDHSFAGCQSALIASADFYRRLRAQIATPSLIQRFEAERAVIAYLDQLSP